jgi:hypothetical protein
MTTGCNPDGILAWNLFFRFQKSRILSNIAKGDCCTQALPVTLTLTQPCPIIDPPKAPGKLPPAAACFACSSAIHAF